MDIELIKQFLVLSETLSFKVAAGMLFISQSALSKHIMKLEQELDTMLLKRNTRSVQLTNEGLLFKAAATEFIAQFEAVTDSIKGIHELVGKIRIGGAIRLPQIAPVLERTIASCEEKHPNVSFYVEDIEFQDFREYLNKRVFDIVFSVHFPNVIDKGLRFFDLEEVPLCIWVSKDHPFASREQIALSELNGSIIRFLDPEKSRRHVAYMSKLLTEHGVEVKMGKAINRTYSAHDDEILGILPEFQHPLNSNLKTIILEDAEPVVLCAVCLIRNNSQIVAAFFDELEKERLRTTIMP